MNTDRIHSKSVVLDLNRDFSGTGAISPDRLITGLSLNDAPVNVFLWRWSTQVVRILSAIQRYPDF